MPIKVDRYVSLCMNESARTKKKDTVKVKLLFDFYELKMQTERLLFSECIN